MRDLTILVHKDYTESVIDSLHEEGNVEVESVENAEKTAELVKEESIPEITSKFTDYDMKLSSVLDVFEKVEEKEESIKDLLNPPEIEKLEREKRTVSEIFEQIDKLMEKNGDRIIELDTKLEKIKTKTNELKETKKDLKLIIDLDLNLEYIRTSTFTTIYIGKTANFTKLKDSVSKIDEAFCKKIKSTEYEETIVLTGVYARMKDEFEAALREGEFRSLDLGGLKGRPKEALADIESTLKKLKKKKQTLTEKLRDYKEEWEKEYLALQEELEINREKKEVIQNFGSTDKTSVIKAWTPKKTIDRVEKVISESSDGHAEIIDEEPEDPDYVPISLDNPKPIKPFELLTKMFAPPRYDEVDPTLILAPAFVLFFGLMLGDLMYGLIITVGSVILVKGPGRVEKSFRNFGWIMLSTGLSTMFFGVIQGGYLGPGRDDYPNLLGHFGFETPALLETLEGDGPLILLIISLVIGLSYINIGLILQLVQHIRRKDYKEALLENGSWWLLQIGGFVLISDIMFEFTTIAQLPDIAFTASYVFVIIGLVLLAIRAKGLSFFELTGFIGDLLSFSRILALGLATAGIALTVNIITDLVDFSDAFADIGFGAVLMIVIACVGLGLLVAFFGHLLKKRLMQVGGIFIAFIGVLAVIDPTYPLLIIPLIVFILGHTINLALQGLGSFVHSLRLQYVEFFNYFYGGGGKEFEPFTFKRKHTKLKCEEEMKR